MEYRIESLQGFTLVGMSIECKMSDISGIAPLWDKFVPRMCEVAGMSGVWGACLSNNDPEGFTYIAGCEVPAGTAPPVGMARFEVPAHKYLVTKYVGAAAEMGKHWQEVTGKVLADSGQEGKFDGPWLESYPEDCHDETTGHIKCDLFTPIK